MLKLFCAEKCRGCGVLMQGERDGPMTVCDDCFQPLVCAPVIIERCSVDGDSLPITVASGSPYVGLLKRLIYRLKYDDDRLVAGDLGCLLLRAWYELIKLIYIEHLVSWQSLSEPDGTMSPAALNIILVPVPLFWFRRWRRGFNQSEVLAKRLVRRTKFAEEIPSSMGPTWHGGRMLQMLWEQGMRLTARCLPTAGSAPCSIAVLRPSATYSSGDPPLVETPVCVAPPGIGLSVEVSLLMRARSTKPHHNLGRLARLRNLDGAFAVPRARGMSRDSVLVLVDDIFTSGATLGECSRALTEAGWTRIYGLTVARALEAHGRNNGES